MSRSEWVGDVTGRAHAAVDLHVRGILGASIPSASSPFLALASDNEQWWVKAPDPKLGKALVTEFVVGRCGALIGAPVCAVEPIFISPSLLPYDLRPGVPLVAGIGTATKNLDGTVTEIRHDLTRRYDDDNRVRHAGVYALVDWCFGSDLQWLQRVDADWELHSHDHGWYFPPSGPDWTEQTLLNDVNTPAAVSTDPGGLDHDEIERLACALEAVTRDQLRAIMNLVPASMPVGDSELEALGWFLETRAPSVAARLRAM